MNRRDFVQGIAAVGFEMFGIDVRDVAIVEKETPPKHIADYGRKGTVVLSENYLYVCLGEKGWRRINLQQFQGW